MNKSFCLDFGTTNSVAVFSGVNSRDVVACKTLLFYFEEEEKFFFGDEAWDLFLDGEEGRLFRAVKTFLVGEPIKTKVGSKLIDLSDLISIFIKDIKEKTEQAVGDNSENIIIGRPVVFRNQCTLEDESIAINRLQKAAKKAGFKNVSFVFEPVAAAFGAGINLDGKVLVGDFGGGTSDFTIVDFANKESPKPLSVGGLGIGGDVFDGDLLESLLGDFFGKNVTTRYPLGSGGDMPFPAIFLNLLKEWHLIPLLSTPRNIKKLKELYQTANDKKPIKRLMKVAEYKMGFEVMDIIERTKKMFSELDQMHLELNSIGLSFSQNISLKEFDSILMPRIKQIGIEVNAVLSRAGLEDSEIDKVFLTGGSSKIGLIQKMFQEKFPGKVVISEKPDDIANGIALALKKF